jgi:HAD superfamily hydrolase (TIGR01509 family)
MKIPQHIKAVLFDMDGLLIDSEPYWRRTTEAYFAKYNKPFSDEVHRHIMGRGLRDIIEYFKSEWGFVGDTDAMIVERKEMLYTYLLDNLTLMDGAETLIKALHKKGFLLAVATSGHSVEKTKEIVGTFGLEKCFRVFVSGDDVPNAKPAPDIFLKAAEALAVAPKNCLVFEDAPNGVKAGKAAGMTVYGVNADETIYNKLKRANADYVCSSLLDITL